MDKTQKKRTHKLTDASQGGELYDFLYGELIPWGNENVGGLTSFHNILNSSLPIEWLFDVIRWRAIELLKTAIKPKIEVRLPLNDEWLQAAIRGLDVEAAFDAKPSTLKATLHARNLLEQLRLVTHCLEEPDDESPQRPPPEALEQLMTLDLNKLGEQTDEQLGNGLLIYAYLQDCRDRWRNPDQSLVFQMGLLVDEWIPNRVERFKYDPLAAAKLRELGATGGKKKGHNAFLTTHYPRYRELMEQRRKDPDAGDRALLRRTAEYLGISKRAAGRSINIVKKHLADTVKDPKKRRVR